MQMGDEHKYDICLRAIQVCTIYEDDPTNVQIIADVISKLEDQRIDLFFTETVYNINRNINITTITEFLKSIPVINCKVQKTVTVVSQNNADISDVFTNMNLNDEVSFDPDSSNRDTTDNDSSSRDFSGRFPSTDAGPSNDYYFNSGNVSAYTPNDNPGNSNADPFVVTTYTNILVDFLVFLLSDESDIYPMYIYFSNSHYYYPVYQINYKLFQE